MQVRKVGIWLFKRQFLLIIGLLIIIHLFYYLLYEYDSYPPAIAIENGDFVYSRTAYANVETLDQFFEDMANGVPSSFYYTRYSTKVEEDYDPAFLKDIDRIRGGGYMFHRKVFVRYKVTYNGKEVVFHQIAGEPVPWHGMTFSGGEIIKDDDPYYHKIYVFYQAGQPYHFLWLPK